MLKKIVTYVFVFLLCQSLRAQIDIHVATDKFEYAIGDYIRVEISVSADSTIKCLWPAADEIASYEIISTQPIDTLRENGKLIYRQEIIYSVYEAGNYYFPQVQLPYNKLRDTTIYSVVSDSLPFNVLTPDVDTTAVIKPIKGIKDVSVPRFTTLQIIIGAAVLLIIGLLIWYFFIRKKEKPIIPAKPVVQKSLREIIMGQLNELEAKKLWQQDQLKLYYSELTDILRTYLEKRFTINAMESTSDEIIEQIQHIPEAKQLEPDITYVLQLADMAKFAKSRPLANENVKAMDLVKQFVEQTTPVVSNTEQNK